MKKTLLSVLIACSLMSAHATLIHYTVVLDGPSESPANASPGTGSAIVDYDSSAHTLKLVLSFSGLLGTTTAAHIQAPTLVPFSGNAGVATTTPTFAGFPLGVTSGAYTNILNLTLASSYNPAYVTANGGTVASAEAALVAAMFAGESYLNIHTIVLPGGEIRGFLILNSVSPPIIITPPQSQIVPAGSNATFSVTALGPGQLFYQWQKNGVSIVRATNMNLSFTNLQSTNTGDYTAVVTNAYGSVTSAVARLIVYLPPSTPQPPTPSASPTIQQPPSNLIAALRRPSSTQLVVFTGGGLVDPSKKTIVLTHGFKSSSDDWPRNMATNLINHGLDATANIVAWDWRADANMPGSWAVSLSASSARTLIEGKALGNALLNTLGTSYNLPIHFIGHSLGTLVNCHAADYIHGDDPNSPGNSNPAQKFNSQNTQMTLFDEAELAQVVSDSLNSLNVSLEILFGGQIAAQSGVNKAPWNKVIPDHSAWIDNYISLVGLAHVEAANVLLWRNEQLSLPDAHGYSYQWYSNSIINPFGSLMGHRWSSELTLNGAPARDSCFAQALDSDPFTLQLVPLNPIVATLDVYPSLQAFRALSALGGSVYGIFLDGIQYAGNFVANVAQEFTPPSGQPVFVGTANSTPAYYLPPLSSSPYQSGYSLQFTLQPAAAPQLKAQGLSNPTPADSGGSATNSVYVWVPVSVPPAAIGLSFQFQLTGAGTNEYMTMGISNENYFSLESEFIQDGAWTASSVMDISQYAAQQVQLFFSLNGNGAAPSGQLSVQAIQFYSVPAPALNIAVQGTNAVLSWPVTALGWQLEATDILSASNQWTALTNLPVVVDYENVITNNMSSATRFYRLRK